MDIFKNYRNEDCILSDEQEKNISTRHPDATKDLISNCLIDPSEIRKSSSNNISHLYYITKTENADVLRGYQSL